MQVLSSDSEHRTYKNIKNNVITNNNNLIVR